MYPAARSARDGRLPLCSQLAQRHDLVRRTQTATDSAGSSLVAGALCVHARIAVYTSNIGDFQISGSHWCGQKNRPHASGRPRALRGWELASCAIFDVYHKLHA